MARVTVTVVTFAGAVMFVVLVTDLFAAGVEDGFTGAGVLVFTTVEGTGVITGVCVRTGVTAGVA